jgi:MraZ protein
MVERFLGRQVKRIDAKGRVSIPAPFRAVLGRDGYDGLFLVRSPTHPAVDGGGHALLSAIEATLARYDPFSFEHAALATTLLGQGDSPTLDGEGRMVVPEWLRAATGITEEVLFVGLGHRFQIWAPARFADFEIEARATARRLLGVTSSAEGTP